jgi:uncharacterized protein (TIGR04255 family)
LTDFAQGTARRQYAHPPIREALCEFQFSGDAKPLDLALPGRLVDRLDAEYRGATNAFSLVQASIRQADEGGQATISVPGSPTRIRMLSKDGSRAISIGPASLTVHVLNPYPGWDAFRPEVADAFAKFVALTEPTHLARMSVRYINDVRIPRVQFETTDFFNISLHVGDGPPDTFTSVTNQVVYLDDDGTLFGLKLRVNRRSRQRCTRPFCSI